MDERGQAGREGALEDEHRQERIPDISPCTTSNLDIEIRTDGCTRSEQSKHTKKP